MKKLLSMILAIALVLGLGVNDTPQKSFVAEVSAVNIQEIIFPVLRTNGGSPIKGVDISSIVAIEEAGVVFRNAAGQPQDIFMTLRDHGVNYIRARVWNDPRDAQGRTYGGGRNDAAMAGVIGRRAAQYGMKLLVDYHYSDFWADPGKQRPPKAWAGYNITQMSNAIHDFTRDTLRQIRAAGADIGMVQIGNETNFFMCGFNGMDNLSRMFNAGARAVRDFDPNILVAVHFTNATLGNGSTMEWYAQELRRLNVDYDVYMISYYSFWHGDIANLNRILTNISRTYGKYVVVGEIAYPYTDNAGDGFGHAITSRSHNPPDVVLRYPVSPQGQVDMMTDVYRMLAGIPANANGTGGGIGAFYWEPAWLGVMGITAAQRTQRWEEFGSGWATRWAGEFDPEAQRYGTGGSSYQNKALFDFTGRPLDSLAFYRHVRASNEPAWGTGPTTTTTTRVTTPPTTTPPTTTTTRVTTTPPTTTTVTTTTTRVTTTVPTTTTTRASTTTTVATTVPTTVTTTVPTTVTTVPTTVTTVPTTITTVPTTVTTVPTTVTTVPTTTTTVPTTTTTTVTTVPTTTTVTTVPTTVTTVPTTVTTVPTTITTVPTTTTTVPTTTTTTVTTVPTTVTTVPTTTTVATTTSVTYDCCAAFLGDCLIGDVDDNGIVNISDALEILKFLAGIDSLLDEDETAKKHALVILPDTREEKVPKIHDVLEILKKLAGMASEVPRLTRDG